MWGIRSMGDQERQSGDEYQVSIGCSLCPHLEGRLSHSWEEVRISHVYTCSKSIQAEGTAKRRAGVARVRERIVGEEVREWR